MLNPEIQKLMHEMWDDIERARQKVITNECKTNPERHKLSSLLAEGVSASDYSYYSVGRDGRKAEVRWCFMNKPNVAGYYLTWRERITGRTLKRTHRKAWKTVGRANTEAMRRSKAEREHKEGA